MALSPAKEEITNFLLSGEAGRTTDLKLDKLKRAAEQMFTLNGLNCPVGFMSVKGVNFMVNREQLENGNGHGPDNT